MNDRYSFGENEYSLILSKLLAEGKLHKSNLLRLIKAREFDCSKKPFDSYEQQIKYIRDTSQNLLFMGLSCLIELNDDSLRRNLSEYFGLSLGLARFVLAAGSLSQNKCYSLFLPTGIDYSIYFEGRINDPTKVWKLSPMDVESINRWEDYSKAKDNMMEHTDTDFSPWYIVESDIKKKSRVNCISHILSKIPYQDIEHETVELPERTPADSYERPSRSRFNYVPEIL